MVGDDKAIELSSRVKLRDARIASRAADDSDHGRRAVPERRLNCAAGDRGALLLDCSAIRRAHPIAKMRSLVLFEIYLH